MFGLIFQKFCLENVCRKRGLSEEAVLDIQVKVKVSVMSDCLQPHGLYSHGILEAKILEWLAFPFSRVSSQPRDQTHISHIAGRFFTSWARRETFWASKWEANIQTEAGAGATTLGMERREYLF